VKNRYHILQDTIKDEDTNIEYKWNLIKEAWKYTCEGVIGKSERQHNECISANTLEKLDIRKTKKEVLNRCRTRTSRRRRKSIQILIRK
jgi:hypothetical protein